MKGMNVEDIQWQGIMCRLCFFGDGMEQKKVCVQ